MGSRTGFAEGDAMSVTAMLAANLVCQCLSWVAHTNCTGNTMVVREVGEIL